MSIHMWNFLIMNIKENQFSYMLYKGKSIAMQEDNYAVRYRFNLAITVTRAGSPPIQTLPFSCVVLVAQLPNFSALSSCKYLENCISWKNRF